MHWQVAQLVNPRFTADGQHSWAPARFSLAPGIILAIPFFKAEFAASIIDETGKACRPAGHVDLATVTGDLR